jgi:type IV pilus assembly protein PilP
MRYLISIICIALLLGGCDSASGVQAKPKVVRKKIVAPKDNTAQVRKKKKKTMRTAKLSTTDKQRKKKLLAKFDQNPTAAQKQPDVAKDSKTQPVTAQKQQAAPIENAAFNPADQKKPTINPKSDITEIEQVVENKKQQVVENQKQLDKKVQPAPDSPSVASDKTVSNKLLVTQKFQPDGIPAKYDPNGKIDPFEPLFKEEKVVAARQLKRKKRTPRTPLEHIELGQLKLVGIILAKSGNRALVEEASGKGYVIKEGTYIGTNGGKIVSIQKEIVTVEEELEDIYGKLIVHKRELKLPKPPGEF